MAALAADLGVRRTTEPERMNQELRDALARLCARGRRYDRLIPILKAHRQAATPILVRLLAHPDPGWHTGAAAAFARMRATPPNALPGLLRILKSPDARAQIAAIAALDWLPRTSQGRAIPAVIRLVQSRPVPELSFTATRAHLPRAVGAHFLGLHGGSRGRAVLARALRKRRDPIRHHIVAALEDAANAKERATKARRRTTR